MKTRASLVAFGFIVSASLSVTAQLRAEPITFQAHGHMIEALNPDFQIGDTFVATFTFDTAAPPVSSPSPFEAGYFGVRYWQFVFDNGYIFGSSDSTKDTLGETDISNNNTADYFNATDRYTVTFVYATSMGLPLPSGQDFRFLQIDMWDENPLGNPEMLSAITLPTTPPSIALADIANGRLVYEQPGIPDQPFFVLDSFTVVPEPASLTLAMFGIGMIVASQRLRISIRMPLFLASRLDNRQNGRPQCL